MKTKAIYILALLLVGCVVLFALCACSSAEQDLDGLYIVTFQFNGGILDNGSNLVKEKIDHAYNPNSLAIDIANFGNYSLRRTDYVFKGWFIDEAFTQAWNFSTDKVTQNVTLYAKWEKAVRHTYSVYLSDGTTETLLGSYVVSQGETFSDNGGYTTTVLNQQHNKTCVGLYSDLQLFTEWSDSFSHPGGDQDTDVKVYVKAIQGVWALVDSYEDLVASKSQNIYLTQNIDCQNKKVYFGDYNKEFNGNGYTISNIAIDPQRSGTTKPEYSLFGDLGKDANIHDVTFENVFYDFDIRANQTIYASALAQSAEIGFAVSNVTVTGSYVTDATAQEKLNPEQLKGALNDNTNQTEQNVVGFTANITAKVA